MFCSLKTVMFQDIPPRTWTPVRFEMHNSAESARWHPSRDLDDPASALITPAGILPGIDVQALIVAMVQWAPTSQRGRLISQVPVGQEFETVWGQTACQIARDPYSAAKLDPTATKDHANTPGSDYDTNAWVITIRNGQPLALRVWHDDPGNRLLKLAELKVRDLPISALV